MSLKSPTMVLELSWEPKGLGLLSRILCPISESFCSWALPRLMRAEKRVLLFLPLSRRVRVSKPRPWNEDSCILRRWRFSTADFWHPTLIFGGRRWEAERGGGRCSIMPTVNYFWTENPFPLQTLWDSTAYFLGQRALQTLWDSTDCFLGQTLSLHRF